MYHYTSTKFALLLFVLLFCTIFIAGTNNNDSSDSNDSSNDSSDNNDIDYSYEKNNQNTFDYIVVGLGQGGCVAAARLAESGRRVLGIEAGPVTHRSLGGTDYVASDLSYNSQGKVVINTPYTRFDVPGFFTTIYVPPTPYPEWTMLKNGRIESARVGKLLGGSGAHNGMIYLRFTAETINGWGVSGWSYNDVLPYWKKAENVTGSTQANFPYYHGFTGPIQVSDTPTSIYYSSIPIWLEACNNTGLPMNPDYAGPSRYGCGKQVYNIRRGVRDSSAQAYLPAALKRGNLKITTDSEATRILIKKGKYANSKPVAYGIEYVKDDKIVRVFANKEIVVAGSPIFTPKILQLSGIGPASVLNKFGIKVWVNNANVGRNLRTNQIAFGEYEYPNATYPNGLKISEAATSYAFNGTGPWAHGGQFSYGYACINKSKCSQPDFMFATAVGGSLISQGSNAKTISTQIGTHLPKVVGIVELSSADYRAPPNVTMDDWGFQEDIDAAVGAFKYLRKVFNTYPATTIFGREIAPGPAYTTDAELAEYVKAIGIARFHWAGSCKFGNYNDPTACLDPKLRVVGVDGLRVGDTSIFPSTNTHTSAAAVLAGERVAAFILE